MTSVLTSHAEGTLPAGTWAVDPVHSAVEFAVDYMAGTFRGSFARFDASLAEGKLAGSAEVASVQVKDPNLEAHLQSPEFFDAERHPLLSFESRDMRRSGNDVAMDGKITIKGHTDPIRLTGTISDPSPDPYGNERFGLRLQTTVDRTTFGMNWNAQLPNGKAALSNEVTLLADLQFVQVET
jgi:polyisoprenoid-binding protein YceI